jgi:hypothetical protein
VFGVLVMVIVAKEAVQCVASGMETFVLTSTSSGIDGGMRCDCTCVATRHLFEYGNATSTFRNKPCNLALRSYTENNPASQLSVMGIVQKAHRCRVDCIHTNDILRSVSRLYMMIMALERSKHNKNSSWDYNTKDKVKRPLRMCSAKSQSLHLP